MYLIAVVLSLFFKLSTGSYFDYCLVECPDKDQHVFCYRGGDCSPINNCTEVRNSNVLRDYILFWHNRLRNFIACGQSSRYPPASNMNILSYDEELEYSASCWANLCLRKLDKWVETPRYQGSQVRYEFLSNSTSLTKEDVDVIVVKFNHELDRMNVGEVDSYSGMNPTTNAIAMLLSARVRSMGCAQVVPDNSAYHYLYCNFAPAGARLNEPLYLRGQPCSMCGNQTCNKEYRALCGDVNYYARDNAEIEVPKSYRIYIMSLSIVLTYFNLL